MFSTSYTSQNPWTISRSSGITRNWQNNPPFRIHLHLRVPTSTFPLCQSMKQFYHLFEPQGSEKPSLGLRLIGLATKPILTLVHDNNMIFLYTTKQFLSFCPRHKYKFLWYHKAIFKHTIHDTNMICFVTI